MEDPKKRSIIMIKEETVPIFIQRWTKNNRASMFKVIYG